MRESILKIRRENKSLLMVYMKAVIITKPGGPEVLQLKERTIPQPGDNEVLIKVKAAGVNRPDVSQRKGNYPPPREHLQIFPGWKWLVSLTHAAIL